MSHYAFNLIAAGAMFLVAPSWAQSYPDRAIQVISPYSPGGLATSGVRAWLPYMEKCLGNGAALAPINIEGSGGQLGWAQLARSDADGYTLGLVLLPNFATSLVTRPNLPFEKDSFEYLARFYGNNPTLAAGRDSDIKTLDDLLKKARQETVNVGIAAFGNEDMLLVYNLQKLDPTLKFEMIPLEGTQGKLAAIMGGHIDVSVFSVGELTSAVGDVAHGLAVAKKERSENLPDLPTFAENGLPIELASAHVIAAPKGLPPEVSDKLKACFSDIQNDQAFIGDVKKLGLNYTPGNAENAVEQIDGMISEINAAWEEAPWE